MEQGILGGVVYFFQRLVHLPQGLSEIVLQSASTARLQMQRSYPDQLLRSDVESRALETLPLYDLMPLVTRNSLMEFLTIMEGR